MFKLHKICKIKNNFPQKKIKNYFCGFPKKLIIKNKKKTIL